MATWAVNVFIDESGSFVSAAKPDSWNCVAAYVSSESDRRHLKHALANLKKATGVSILEEVKLRGVAKDDYFRFLSALSKLSGVLFVAATDAGLNTLDDVRAHQRDQAERIVEHKSKMLHQAAREGLQALSDRVKALAPQLYVQLQCQVTLLATIIANAILYFVQRRPETLHAFRWRIDQKNSSRTQFEDAFVALAPALLQTISLEEPIPMLVGADYRYFRRFEYSEAERPTYLRDVYGIDAGADGLGVNIGMLLREDLRFEDSKHNRGVQVADLLAAGVRRCLRAGFDRNDEAARLIGALMVQPKRGRAPIEFLKFSKGDDYVSGKAEHVAMIMQRIGREMLAH